MATYVIGDVHGCYQTLRALLEKIRFQPSRDSLWFVGDLVNKGPRSLEVLQWVRDHSDCSKVVLGNHDFHFLSCFHGCREVPADRSLQALLDSSEVVELENWLRSRPLLIEDSGYLLVHAGVLPAWNPKKLSKKAARASEHLKAKPVEMLRAYGSRNPSEPTVVAARALTLIRCCWQEDEPLWDYTGPPHEAPAGALPWFTFESIETSGFHFLFGHWARMGLLLAENLTGLDTGCVYGGTLSALRLEDHTLFQSENVD